MTGSGNLLFRGSFCSDRDSRSGLGGDFSGLGLDRGLLGGGFLGRSLLDGFGFG
jgi:hypothetical protein